MSIMLDRIQDLLISETIGQRGCADYELKVHSARLCNPMSLPILRVF